MRIDVLRKLQNPLTLSAHRDRMRRWRSHQHASAAIRTGVERAALVVGDTHETRRAPLARALTTLGTKSKTAAAACSWHAAGSIPPRTSDTSSARARCRRLVAG